MAKFIPGRILITAGALRTLTAESVQAAFLRHLRGDWGEVCPEDAASNDEALRIGARLVSAYRDDRGTRFWIITEADRSATTILLPEEY